MRWFLVVCASVTLACPGVMNSVGSAPSGTLSADGGSVDGVPCDVANALAANCLSCHGNSGSVVALTSRAALLLPSSSDPSQTLAQRMAARLTDGSMPPAGSPAPTAAEIATLIDWVNQGAPAGTCAQSTVPDVFSASPTCTSGSHWTGGNDGNQAMNPGEACISCHQRSGGEAPAYLIAGTVYSTGHDPDLCAGFTPTASDPVQVEITDSAGHVYSTNVGVSGNFSLSARRMAGFTLPYFARIVQGTRERRMSASQTTGDCNSCHTAAGTMSAPGRIALPLAAQ